MIAYIVAVSMEFYSDGLQGGNDFATFYTAICINSLSKVKSICKLLDINPATLKRYLSGKSNPPKALVRLLFHESHFGRSATDTHAHEGHILAMRQLRSLQSELEKLKADFLALELENDALKRAKLHESDTAANSSRWIA